MATLAFFFGGLAVLALFVLVERRAEDPVVPLDLFSERIIAVSALGNLAMGGVLLAVSVYVPLFVQGVLGGAGALAASLSPAFWVLLFFGLSALAVATLFPHGTAKDLVSREEDYG